MILIMTGQVLFFDDFSEKDPHLNAVERINHLNVKKISGNCVVIFALFFETSMQAFIQVVLLTSVSEQRLSF